MNANKLIVSILLAVSLSGCGLFGKTVKPQMDITPEDVAKVRIQPKLELPEALDLSAYRVEPKSFLIYKKDDKTYVAIPEKDFQNIQSLLLVLKNRIYNLQEIISDANK